MADDVSLSTGTTSLLSGSIKWTGLASGTDFGSIVDQLIEIESIQVTRLETWKSEWEAKIESIEGLNERMNNIRTFCRDYDTYDEFYERTSTSTNTSVVSTVTTSSVLPGTHKVVVGSNIQGMVASTSWQSAVAVGGGGQGDLVITVGDQVLTLTENAEWSSAFTLDDLASAINYYDNSAAWGGLDILGDVYTVEDKDRNGTIYKRLIITGNTGGDDYQVSVAGGPSSAIGLDRNTVDETYYKTWLGTSSALAGGSYTGSTNKTFTFTPITTGNIGEDAVTIRWADTKGNAGTFDVNSVGVAYEVMQGVTLTFTSGLVIKNDSFTVDAYNPTMQNAQDKGLAQVEQEVHQGFSDLLTSVTTIDAQFVYYYEGERVVVDILEDSKLGDLVDAINDDPNNPGVTASVINDGLDSSTSYHLVLTGQDTGAHHAIDISSGTTLDNFDVFDGTGKSLFTTAQKAADSMFKIDGYPEADYSYIHRATNTVSDIVDGLIMELHDAGESTVTVSNDLSAIEEKVTLFVSSVNYLLDYIDEETAYDADTGETGIMIGNYTYDMVRNAVNEILARSIPGLDSDSDAFVHLSQIGIQTDPDLGGEWIIDSTALADALKDDLDSVAKLFVVDETTGSEGVFYQLYEKMVAFTDSETGIGNVLINNYDGIIQGIDDKIAREERRIALVRQRLEDKFSRLEVLLGELDSQATYVESQLEKLSSSD